MNGALAWRFWRDGLVLLVILGAAITATEVLLMGALGEFSTQELATWMRVEFVQRIMKTFLGADLTPDISATGFMALGFTHPLIYALIWTFILTAATRVPAAEVERGTSDLLYTLPLSRGAIYRSAGLSLATGDHAAHWRDVGGRFARTAPGADVGTARLGKTHHRGRQSPGSESVRGGGGHCCFRLHLAARRGHRDHPGLAARLVLLEFLGQFAEFARGLGPAGILHYYRPLPLVRSGDWPVGDMLVLLGVAAVSWSAGLIRVRTRDFAAT
jgi:hypothetical protein